MNDPKQSLCFALDVPDGREAVELVETLTPHVGLFKVGLELFVREGPGLLASIRSAGAERIFLDLKFHDIPRTVRRALRSASRLGVDFVSVHCECLRGFLLGEEGDETRPFPGVLGVTVLTSVPEDALDPLGYRPGTPVLDLVLRRAKIARDAGCAGVVCSGKEVAAVRELVGPGMFLLTPGVRPAWSLLEGDDQARVHTPAEAIRAGSDCVVVGRPIRSAADPREAAGKVLAEIEEGYRARGRR